MKKEFKIVKREYTNDARPYGAEIIIDKVVCMEETAIEKCQNEALDFIRKHKPIHEEEQWIIRFDGVETTIENGWDSIVFEVVECG